ncbi:hypothetical protein H311_01559 [Anncaliia algerae PRA109]|nr:hypothetical protein H311_01559 [Anncaliia algerae PRA109]
MLFLFYEFLCATNVNHSETLGFLFHLNQYYSIAHPMYKESIKRLGRVLISDLKEVFEENKANNHEKLMDVLPETNERNAFCNKLFANFFEKYDSLFSLPHDNFKLAENAHKDYCNFMESAIKMANSKDLHLFKKVSDIINRKFLHSDYFLKEECLTLEDQHSPK